MKKRNRYKSITLVLPQSTIQEIQRSYTKGQGLKLDYLLVCAYIIYRHSIGGYLGEIHSSYFLKTLTSKYKKYLDWLKNHNLIVTDNHFIKASEGNAKSKSYSLTADYTDLGFIQISFPKPIVGKTSAESCYSVCEEDQIVTQIAWKNLHKFKIDPLQALHYLNIRQKGLIDTKEPLDPSRLLGTVTGIINLANQNHYAKSCPYGRIHTHYTKLDKFIKETCISHSTGKSLVHIDIKNSQPAILGALLHELLDPNDVEAQKELAMYDDYTQKDLYHIMGMIHPCHTYLEISDNPVKRKEFEEQYARNLDTKEERSSFKKEILKMMFDKGTNGIKFTIDKSGKFIPIKSERVFITFKIIFPNLYAKMVEIKANGYEELARMMQRFESRKILHPLIRFLDEKMIDFISIHDSIIILEEEKDIVFNEFNRILLQNNLKTTLETTFLSK